MGKAIIIQDVNFASSNIGTVTLSGDIELRALFIDAPDTFIGYKLSDIRPIYVPINTTYRGVEWSITNGDDYATIDSETGELTISAGADSDEVTVCATSISNPQIMAYKNITVTYSGQGETPLTSITAGLGSYITLDFKPSAGTNIYTKFKPVSDKAGSILGSREAYATKEFYIGIDTIHDRKAITLRWAYGTYNSRAIYYTPGVIEINLTRGASATANNVQFKVDGVVKTTDVTEGNVEAHTPTYDIALYGRKLPTGIESGPMTTIYEFTLTNKDSGDVMHCLKPYLVDGVPMFKDTATGNYYEFNNLDNVTYE